MYCDFYQLTERPFNVTPDPKFLYLNARYREAIASLNYGITQRKGFITLIGEAGTGKTTLLKRLLEDLDAKTKSVFIFNTNVTFEEILEYIFAEFDLPVHNGKKLYMLQRLNAFLLEELRGGVNVALLIDEAQDLEFSVLEDLRLLSNLETAKEKILQIVLSGQPELGQKLSNPVLRQLRQRIGINCRLLPLSRDEITEYVRFRLQAAGCPDLKLFSREAEDQIYHFSRGIPRLVNVVCDNALVIGYALGKKRIGADLITEAAADLLSVEPGGEEIQERPATVSTSAPSAPTSSRWRARFGVIGLVVAAMIVGLLSVGRTMLNRRGDEAAPPAVVSQAFEVIRPGTQPQGGGVEIPAALTGNGLSPPEAAPDTGGRPDAAEPSNRDVAAVRPEERLVDPAPSRVEPVGVNPPPALPAEVPARAPADDGTTAGTARERHALAEREALPRVDERLATTSHAERQGPAAPAAPVPAPPAAPAANPPVVQAANPPVAQAANANLAEPREGNGPAHGGAIPQTADDPAVKAWQRRDSAEPETVAAVKPSAADEQRPAAAPVPAEASNTARLDGVQFDQQAVRVGDSMSAIAKRKYGQSTYTILDLLKLANPELSDIDQISVGQTIRLPELSEGFPILNEGPGRYALLVYSTPHASRATNLQKALRARGFAARVAGASVGYQKPVFRVVLSGFGNRDEVVGVGRALQKLFREDTQIAQLGE